jgi:hypothetical protein
MAAAPAAGSDYRGAAAGQSNAPAAGRSPGVPQFNAGNFASHFCTKNPQVIYGLIFVRKP